MGSGVSDKKYSGLAKIGKEAKQAIEELIDVAKIKEGDLFVIGCSSSEIAGEKLGTFSSEEIGKAIFEAVYPVLSEKNIFLAAQCCEHLNRAVILEQEAARYYRLEQVNVIPALKAGGSFATATYNGLKNPVAVEGVKAQAGLDIGDVLIGMQLAAVAVPVRLSINQIGEAHITAARVRPKFVGGIRAIYNEDLL